MRNREKKPVVVAVIPARAGSKGLPGKNVYPILGHPMIAWTIRAAIECPEVTHVFVISDGADILEVAKHYGARTIREPKSLGGPSISNYQVLAYAIKNIRRFSIKPDIIIYLQPTSPQRDAEDVARALRLFRKPTTQGVISVYEVDNKFLKSFLIKKGNLRFLSDEPWPLMIRSRLPRTYMNNGAIMAIRARAYDITKRLFAPRMVHYLMSAERSFDIDYLQQAKQASAQMRREGRAIQGIKSRRIA